ncbi:hypothetical protein L598_002400000080 [Mesorhizobium sp. J18]|nr:hypothetical protein L598_002400000080 [Mesorhizobium sp. J18]
MKAAPAPLNQTGRLAQAKQAFPAWIVRRKTAFDVYGTEFVPACKRSKQHAKGKP